MKILLTNNHLDIYAGTETWTYTMASELVRLGHEVDVFTFQKGLMTLRLQEFCKVTVHPIAWYDADYDLILINHNTCLREVKRLNGTKVMTCHGIYPALEQPEHGADVYVAISEEVQDHLQECGIDKPIIIRNGIDCERFKPTQPVNETLRNVLLISTSKYMRGFIGGICRDMGLSFRQVNKSQRVWDIEKQMNWADLVISLGRGALEAAACARNVIVYDSRPYMEKPMGDGLLCPNEALLYALYNFSGRYLKRNYTAKDIIRMFAQFSARIGTQLRETVLLNFNIKHTASQYLELVK